MKHLFANDGNTLYLVCYWGFRGCIQLSYFKLYTHGCSLFYINYSSLKLVRGKKKWMRCSHVK